MDDSTNQFTNYSQSPPPQSVNEPTSNEDHESIHVPQEPWTSTNAETSVQADKVSKATLSTSTTSLNTRVDSEGFKVPIESKPSRKARGRGKSVEPKTRAQCRSKSRPPVTEIDFTDDEELTPTRNRSLTQVERSTETDMLNKFSSMLNAQTETLKGGFRADLEVAVREIDQRLDNRLDQMENSTNTRLTRIDQRLVALESQQPSETAVIEQLTAKADAIDQRFAAFEIRLEEFNRMITQRAATHQAAYDNPRMNAIEQNMDRNDQ